MHRIPSRTLGRTLPVTLTLCLVLGGCTSPIPKAVRETPVNPLDLAQVQQDPARAVGRQVRWGGTIIAIDNRPAVTEIEVLARPLDTFGEPLRDRPGEGRFIARLAGFLDPAEYAKDRALTVVGTLSGMETRPVGDYPYSYPLIQIETHYLWPKVPPPSVYDYPPWFNPWYSPWYSPWYGPGYGPWLGPLGPHPGPRRGRWYH